MKYLKKAIKIIFIIGVAFALIITLINSYIMIVGGKGFEELDEISGSYDCAIVLGAKVGPDGTVSYMLRDRLDYAYDLYEKGVVPKILVSGDHGETDYDEVNSMRQYLLDKGAAIEDIFMDHAGFDTYATMYRAKEIFQVEGAVICTQKYHLYRAVYIAKRMGLDAKGVASDVYVSSKLPYFRAREWAARLKAFWEVEISKPTPILGEEIPISGDGTITEDGKT